MPHQTNNHKPKALHLSSFVSYILLAIALQLVFQIVIVTRPQVLGLATDITASQVLTLVNQDRLQNGLSPVKPDPLLDRAAELKAEDMFAKNYWSHVSPQGATPWDFINKTGYRYLYAGENLARDFATSDQVVKAWMNSPSHRANILNPKYQDMGLAVVNGNMGGEETTLVVEMFGTKQTNTPVVSSASTAQPEAETTSLSDNRVITNPVRTPVKPALNVLSLSKDVSYLIALFLLMMLGVDAYLVRKKKIIRASGNNFAHMALLLFMLLAIFITQSGAIL